MNNETQRPFDVSGWVTIAEARAILGVSRAWIYVLLQKGTIRSAQIFGRRLLLREDVVAYSGRRREREKKRSR